MFKDDGGRMLILEFKYRVFKFLLCAVYAPTQRHGHFRDVLLYRYREDQHSDEAHFHLDCNVNSQNFRLWSHGKPDVIAEVLFYLVKITNGAMRKRGVTGLLQR